MGKNDDYISSENAEKLIETHIKLEDTRKHIQSIIKDYVEKVDFMEKVRKYASMEIDSRLFVNLKFWMITVVSAILSSMIGILVLIFLKKIFHLNVI